MDPKDLLGRMFAVSSRDEPEEPPLPMLEAQAMGLRARWDAFNEPPDVKPGDLVMHKPGLGSRRKPYRDGQLMILWRMLDAANSMDTMHVERYLSAAMVESADQVDCIIAHIGSDGAGIAFRPDHTRQLCKWHPDEAIQRSLDAPDAPSDAQPD